MPKFSYARKFVAFIDVLGFSELIKRSEREPDLLDAILGTLSVAGQASPLIGPPNYPKDHSYVDFVQTSFSDSIVISSEASVEGLMTVMEISRAFSCIMLQSGFLTRGGVSLGSLYHTEGKIIGPAFIEAYKAESTVADYPRIIFDRSALSFLKENIKRDDVIGEYFRSTIRISVDGPYFLHILRELEESAIREKEEHQKTKCDSKYFNMHDGWWRLIREKTIEMRNASESDPKIFRKVKWHCDYYNRSIGSCYPLFEERDCWLTQIPMPIWSIPHSV